jgi:hypothetical protein
MVHAPKVTARLEVSRHSKQRISVEVKVGHLSSTFAALPPGAKEVRVPAEALALILPLSLPSSCDSSSCAPFSHDPTNFSLLHSATTSIPALTDPRAHPRPPYTHWPIHQFSNSGLLVAPDLESSTTTRPHARLDRSKGLRSAKLMQRFPNPEGL